jgi:arylsulfatase A-like enzyme
MKINATRLAGASTRGGALLALGIAAMLAGASYWWHTHHLQAAPAGVVIITLDTTRADRLSAYGYMDVAMPHLDRLAAEGIVFDQATSVAPLTLPAHASLFTGLLPPAHRVHENGSLPLADSQVTLAEILQAQGFRTAGFVGSVVLDADRGLAQGFDHYSGVAPSDGSPDRRQRRADEVISEATRWLDDIGEERFFLWAHLYDPHRPYDPPDPFRAMQDPYVGEIAFVDSQIGRLVEALERQQLLDRTIVIVVGDHGESLGEHGERDHGIFVYESVLRVPFMLRAPNLAPRRVGEVARLPDVMPTVLELLGIPTPAVDGVSLVDLMRGTRHGLGLEAYAESLYPQRFGWSPLHTLRQGRYKFIEAPRPELYDLERDPFEERNVYDQHPTVVSELRQRLVALEQRDEAKGAGRSDTVAVSPALRQRLAALGYVGHSTRGPAPDGERLPDPKDCIGVYNSRQNPGRAGTGDPSPACR